MGLSLGTIGQIGGGILGGVFGGPGGAMMGAQAGGMLGGALDGGGGEGDAASLATQGYTAFQSKKDREAYLKRLLRAGEIDRGAYNQLAGEINRGTQGYLENTSRGRRAALSALQQGYNDSAGILTRKRDAQKQNILSGFASGIGTQNKARAKAEKLFSADRKGFEKSKSDFKNYLNNSENKSAGYLSDNANQSLNYLSPYVESGNKTTDLMTRLLTDPNTRAAEYAKTPGYQFAFDEGNQALDRSAAARGGLLSGASMKAAQKFGSGLANQNYNQFINQLAGASAQGLNASGTSANIQNNLGINLAGNASDYAGRQFQNDQAYNQLFENNTNNAATFDQSYAGDIAGLQTDRGGALARVNESYFDNQNRLRQDQSNKYAGINQDFYNDRGQTRLNQGAALGNIYLNRGLTGANNIRQSAAERYKNMQANMASNAALANSASDPLKSLLGGFGGMLGGGSGGGSGGGTDMLTALMGGGGGGNPFNFATGSSGGTLPSSSMNFGGSSNPMNFAF